MLSKWVVFAFYTCLQVATRLYCRNGLQMGLFVRLWVVVVIFIAFCPLWVAYCVMMCNTSIFAGCGLFFGLYGWIYATPPHPKTENARSGLPFQKFFLKNIFFIFAFVIEVFKPVGVVLSFAGFFSCKRSKIVYFLNVVVGVG